MHSGNIVSLWVSNLHCPPLVSVFVLSKGIVIMGLRVVIVNYMLPVLGSWSCVLREPLFVLWWLCFALCLYWWVYDALLLCNM